jgi:hypothetical protein
MSDIAQFLFLWGPVLSAFAMAFWLFVTRRRPHQRGLAVVTAGVAALTVVLFTVYIERGDCTDTPGACETLWVALVSSWGLCWMSVAAAIGLLVYWRIRSR